MFHVPPWSYHVPSTTEEPLVYIGTPPPTSSVSERVRAISSSICWLPTAYFFGNFARCSRYFVGWHLQLMHPPRDHLHREQP